MDNGELRQVAFSLCDAAGNPNHHPAIVDAVHRLLVICNEVLTDQGIELSYSRKLERQTLGPRYGEEIGPE